MSDEFDKVLWEEATQHPDWYLRVNENRKHLVKLAEGRLQEERREIKDPMYAFIEEKLRQGALPLGKDGENWDEERKPVDSIIIHHTSNRPNLQLTRLNAIHLLNLYVAQYAEPPKEKEHIKGQPIYSHHYSGGEQVFYAYHWLVRMDGATERLLPDEAVGWQAGDWDVNCRSVAICLDNDFEESSPSEKVIGFVADLIRKHYPHITADHVKGHREVNPKTVCPGNTFLDGWKASLSNKLKRRGTP